MSLKDIIDNDFTLLYYENNSISIYEIDKHKLQKYVKYKLDELIDAPIPVKNITNRTLKFYIYIYEKYKKYIDNDKFELYIKQCKKQLQ
jgi:hypothetical protein